MVDYEMVDCEMVVDGEMMRVDGESW